MYILRSSFLASLEPFPSPPSLSFLHYLSDGPFTWINFLSLSCEISLRPISLHSPSLSLPTPRLILPVQPSSVAPSPALSLAMARDGSSGGVIRMAVITPGGVERKFFAGADIPRSAAARASLLSSLPPLYLYRPERSLPSSRGLMMIE
jgi:hypothetical protein